VAAFPSASLGYAILLPCSYIEQLGKTHSAPSIKQHLAAVRMLFNWLVLGQAVRGNLGGAGACSRGEVRQDARSRS
jgi:integrase/recombinase XerD